MARRLILAHEQPEAASLVAAWLVDEWEHLYPDWDHQAAVAELTACGDDGHPPRTWLLFEGDDAGDPESVGTVIGSIGLALEGELPGAIPVLDGDMSGADSIETPSGVWVVNLFVTAAARGRGLGSALLDHAIVHANALGLNELLLTTEHSAEHYESLGWIRIGSTTLNGHESVLMRLPTMDR
jgi:GNAT superfamily N-acetyltransferase